MGNESPWFLIFSNATGSMAPLLLGAADQKKKQVLGHEGLMKLSTLSNSSRETLGHDEGLYECRKTGNFMAL